MISNNFKMLKIPSDYCCPITLHIIQNPVIASDGLTYEKDAIMHWFNVNKKNILISPITHFRLPHKTLKTNNRLKTKILKFKKSHPKVQAPSLKKLSTIIQKRVEILQVQFKEKERILRKEILTEMYSKKEWNLEELEKHMYKYILNEKQCFKNSKKKLVNEKNIKKTLQKQYVHDGIILANFVFTNSKFIEKLGEDDLFISAKHIFDMINEGTKKSYSREKMQELISWLNYLSEHILYIDALAQKLGHEELTEIAKLTSNNAKLIFNNEKLAKKLDHTDLISIAKINPKNTKLILKNRRLAKKLTDDELTAMAKSNLRNAQLVLFQSYLAKKLNHKELTEIAKCDLEHAILIFSNNLTVSKLNEKDLIEIKFNPELSTLVSSFKKSTFIHKFKDFTLVKLAKSSFRYAKSILNNRELSEKLTAKDLFELSKWSLDLANIILHKESLYKKLPSKDLTELAKKNIENLKSVLNDTNLSKNVINRSLIETAKLNYQSAEIILNNTFTRSKLSEKDINDLANLDLKLARTILMDDNLAKKLSGSTLATLIIWDKICTKIILKNEKLTKKTKWNKNIVLYLIERDKSLSEIILNNEKICLSLDEYSLISILKMDKKSNKNRAKRNATKILTKTQFFNKIGIEALRVIAQLDCSLAKLIIDNDSFMRRVPGNCLIELTSSNLDLIKCIINSKYSKKLWNYQLESLAKLDNEIGKLILSRKALLESLVESKSLIKFLSNNSYLIDFVFKNKKILNYLTKKKLIEKVKSLRTNMKQHISHFFKEKNQPKQEESQQIIVIDTNKNSKV